MNLQIYAKSDVDTLVMPLLKMLYEQADLQANKVRKAHTYS